MVSERRRYAADQALANAMIEGFEPTQEDLELWEKFVCGEISREELMRIVVDRAHENARNKQTVKEYKRVA